MMKLSPQQIERLLTPDVCFLMQAIAEGGGEARLVGGAVRDMVMDNPIGDCDFAVNLPPERIADIFQMRGAKVVPTGIAHGTVTVVVNGRGYEMTSLRRDVATDGRHARIAYTSDWQEDAARRDFTINALYVEKGGVLTDYWNGMADCASGTVRFIGDAETRIREDVLRILRFYRFYAWFGQGAPDAQAQVACAALSHLIPSLSVERVWRELARLLAAVNPLRACHAMQSSGVLAVLLPHARQELSALSRLLELEQTYGIAPSALRRLMVLCLVDHLPELALRLKFSNRAKNNLATCLAAYQRLKMDHSVPFVGIIYFCGVEAARDAALLVAAEMGEQGNSQRDELAERLRQCDEWAFPRFPLTGKDLQAAGIAAGPEMGRILKKIELWWISHDFMPDAAACLAAAYREKVG